MQAAILLADCELLIIDTHTAGLEITTASK